MNQIQRKILDRIRLNENDVFLAKITKESLHITFTAKVEFDFKAFDSNPELFYVQVIDKMFHICARWVKEEEIWLKNTFKDCSN